MKGKGLYNKYNISRTDGTPIDPNDEYFVLKVNGNGDVNHLEASRKGVLAYAEAIKPYLPELSIELENKYTK